MAPPIKRVAVVGAGAAGLAAVKCCLEEGLRVTCYEQSAYVGGLWHFTEEKAAGSAGVYRSTLSNVSKLFLCFADFPQPHEWPNFLPHYLVSEYLERYATHFDLRRHVKLRHEVLAVGQLVREDGWQVTTRDAETGEEQAQAFDAVMVCAGLHRDPVIPAFPGLEGFKGQVIHTSAYKDAASFLDKVVLVVGFGECAVDAAIEISRLNRKVYISTRNGNWVIPRATPDGLPYEQMHYNRRAKFWNQFSMFNDIDSQMEAICSSRLDHDVFKITPPWRFTQGQPLISEDLPTRVLGGYIELKTGVQSMTSNGVIFTDGSKLDQVDVIVMGTGYNSSYPFIDDKVALKRDGKFDLYKWIFPPMLSPPSVAMIGGVRTLGGHFVTFELQARLAVRVFSGVIQLPDAAIMKERISEQHQKQMETYLGNPRHHVTLDWLQYNDELAELIGCKPSMRSLLVSDPRLAREVWYKPCVPAQYRLTGPGAWPGARDVVMGNSKTSLKPFTTRSVTKKPDFQKAMAKL